MYFTSTKYINCTLPGKASGQYWISVTDESGTTENIICVDAEPTEACDGTMRWELRSNSNYRLIDANRRELPDMPVSPDMLYYIERVRDGVVSVLYSEPTDHTFTRFIPYRIAQSNAQFYIGRSESNAICYPSEFVSGSHACIVVSDGKVSISDLSSANGTYVNTRAISEKKLENGDVIYIMGLRIIVVNHFLFINNPQDSVRIQSNALVPYHLPMEALPESPGEEAPPTEYYYRAPRFKYDVDRYQLKLDSPPNNQNNNDMPMIMVIGPSVTMGMASVATGLYSVTSAISTGNFGAAIPSLVMCCSMLLGTMMWPVITRRYQRRMAEQKEAKRQVRYKEYLGQMEQKLEQEITRQEKILWDNDISMNIRSAQILTPKPKIWERTQKHTDFLSIRLGSGNLPMIADIQYMERKFSIDDDNLFEAMYQFGEQERWLRNVPICLPLKQRFVSGVCAGRDMLNVYAQNAILQIASLHAYDEVQLVVLYNENDAAMFDFVRWLPHTRDAEKGIRYIATNSEEAKEVSSALDPIIEARKQMNQEQLQDEPLYYVIISLDKRMTEMTECVRRILRHKDNLKFSVLCFCQRLEDLPKECSAVVEIGEEEGQLTLIDDISQPPIPFWKDETWQLDIRGITNVLANTEVDTNGFHFVLPKSYTLFQMLHIGMIEHLNLMEMWKGSDATTSLAAQVGIDAYGEPLRLDLHERAHGPHGLVAGTTGSGKSEFLISYILSMAIHFHPNDVAFILIDYKGGGMAKSFEGMPHTAGVITNLDGNGIKRSLVSMRSELHRRELIFAQTSRMHGVSNIDIYKYQRLYHEGKVEEPLPHLIIISDEFAELKKEQPDFMTELTSTARVGRSLGVHLILATQKPGGVVDDQIRSNSSFKICLKVQDTSDSTEMLGRPEAAALTDAGRFYMQVGNNELFELGQSVWAGAPYYPSPEEISDVDDGVSVISTNGRVIAEANTNRFAQFRNPPKQLDVVTHHIQQVCEREGIKAWKMWLDPIPANISVDDLMTKYDIPAEGGFMLNPLIGEYDDPSHQLQAPLHVPISSDGNVIVYGSAGSGKTMFVEAMCYSLISVHSPDEVNLYLLDFDAELLTAFSGAPHVGDVILAHETERVTNLFKMLMGRIETRKKQLSEFGGTLTQYNASASKPMPNIVVAINNYAVFTELFEDLMPTMNLISREGVKYGIYFVLTCTGINQVRLNLRQNFKCIYCLQLNNADDYSSVIGKTGGMLPEKFAGRGMFRFDKDNVLEFQTARVTLSDTTYDFIRGYCQELTARYPGKKADRVPVLPEFVTEEYLKPYCDKDLRRVPVGVAKESLKITVFDFLESPVTMVLAENDEWLTFVNALSAMMARQYEAETLVLAPEREKPYRLSVDGLRYFSDTSGCAAAVNEVFKTLLERNNGYKDAQDRGEQPPEYDRKVVVVESLAMLQAMLDRVKLDDAEKMGDDDSLMNRLRLAIEKTRKAYNVTFIIAESVNALNPFANEAWYRTHVNGSRGVWVGNGIGGQYRFTVHRRPQGASDELKEGFGFIVHNSAATMVKFLQ